MHYYRQRSSNRTIANGYYFDAIPTSNNKLVGNRDHLSEGDIRGVLDAYRCRWIPQLDLLPLGCCRLLHAEVLC